MFFSGLYRFVDSDAEPFNSMIAAPSPRRNSLSPLVPPIL
jgi:hypothetical protein